MSRATGQRFPFITYSFSGVVLRPSSHSSFYLNSLGQYTNRSHAESRNARSVCPLLRSGGQRWFWEWVARSASLFHHLFIRCFGRPLRLLSKFLRPRYLWINRATRNSYTRLGSSLPNSGGRWLWGASDSAVCQHIRRWRGSWS